MRFTVAFILIATLANVAHATQQITDKIIFGDNEFSMDESPMVGYWDDTDPERRRPAFEWQVTSNRKGYEATFEIRDSKLFLREIVGKIKKKIRKNQQILPDHEFPVLADWFTGRIHMGVGGFDNSTWEWKAVIVFHIDKGIVTHMGFVERYRSTHWWNGMPPDDDAGTANVQETRREQVTHLRCVANRHVSRAKPAFFTGPPMRSAASPFLIASASSAKTGSAAAR